MVFGGSSASGGGGFSAFGGAGTPGGGAWPPVASSGPLASFTGASIGERDVAAPSLPAFQSQRGTYVAAPASTSFDGSRIRLDSVQAPGEAWGSGYDEGFATRKQIAERSKMSGAERADVFSQRFPTKHLVFPSGVTDGSYPPLAGHTPAIKHSARVAGTKNAVTGSHHGRDHAREDAIDRSQLDPAGRGYEDAAMMARLATHKYMSAPKEELDAVQLATSAYSKHLYMTHTRVGDLRNKADFNEMTAIVQEQREKHKWESAALLHSDAANAELVPPVMKAFLGHHGNDPEAAMSAFRTAVHSPGAWGPPPVNTAPKSDTDDFTHKSLQQMRQEAAAASAAATTGAPPKARPRALSDARLIPPARPKEVV